MPARAMIEGIDSWRDALPRRRGGSNAVLLTVLLVAIVGSLGAWAMNGTSGATAGWYHDVGDGMDAAHEQARPVLILFTADWCPPCQQLKREVLADDEVREYLEREYVCVKVDLTDQAGPNNEVARDFGITGIPAMHVYALDGTPLGVFARERTPWDFIDWLRECKSWTR